MFVKRWWLTGLLLFALWAVPMVGSAQDGERVALVIGNGAYSREGDVLANPPNDARALAATLRTLDFTVIEAIDLDFGSMRRALSSFGQSLRNADVGLFFYAGHGLEFQGRNYLVPTDAELEAESDVYVNLMALDDILRLMEASVPTRLVILDACRNNPMARRLQRSLGAGRSTVVGSGLAEMQAAVGTLIAYATAPGAVAYDGDGPNSPFTTGLLEHLATPGLEAELMLKRVRASVLQETRDRQVPWVASSLRGSFLFNAGEPEPVAAPEPALAATPPPAPDRSAADVLWAAIGATEDAQEWAFFAEHFPDDPRAALARHRAERLAGPTVAALPPPSTPVLPRLSPEEGERLLALERPDWQRVQTALATVGYDPGGRDGIPGRNTRRALLAWQQRAGQPATGRLDEGQFATLLAEAEAVEEASRPRALWEASFGGALPDSFSSAARAADGGFLLAGETRSEGAGREDGWIVKIDDRGSEQWHRTFGGGETDEINAVLATPDGGFLLAGDTRSEGAGNRDGWVVRLDASGRELWRRTFGGTRDDNFFEAAPSGDGGFLLVGPTRSDSAGDWDGWAVRIDGQGRELWRRLFGGAAWDVWEAVHALPDGGFILAGETKTDSAGDFDGWVARLDRAGNELWQRQFGGAAKDILLGIAEAEDGGFVLAGYTRSDGAGDADGWLVKLASDGRERWRRTFGGAAWDDFSSITRSADGGFVMAGETRVAGDEAADGWLLGVDREGRERWRFSLGGESREAFAHLLSVSTDDYLALGRSYTDIAGTTDGWVARVRRGAGDPLQMAGPPGPVAEPAGAEPALGQDTWRDVQRALTALGFRTRQPDGRPDLDTRIALANWQRARGGLGTGRIDDRQLAALVDEALPRLAEPRPVVLWERTFGGGSADRFDAVLHADDGGFLAAGSTESEGVGEQDGWLVKVDAGGREQWRRSFGGAKLDVIDAVAQAQDGYVIAGDTMSEGAGGRDGWLVKLDRAGRELWRRTYGGDAHDGFQAVVPAGDGGFLLAGGTKSEGGGDWDGWLVKVDDEGREQWRKVSGGTGWDSWEAAVPTEDNGFVLVGAYRSGGTETPDIWVARIDASGQDRWRRTIGQARRDVGLAVVAAGDGGFVLAGDSDLRAAYDQDAILLKLDGDGEEVWRHVVGGAAWEDFAGLARTPDGGFVAVGETSSLGAGGADGLVVKVDADGRELWRQTFGGADDDILQAVLVAADGSLVLAGHRERAATDNRDGWLLGVGEIAPALMASE